MSLSRAIPILFSAPMVLALLAGRKTQTRRPLRIQGRKGFTEFGPSDTPGYDWHFRDAHKRWHDLRHAELLARLPWQVGDRLWVRENCWAEYRGHNGTGVLYPADGAWIKTPDTQEAEDRWRKLDCYASSRHPDNDTSSGQLVPSIHMPRWASRLTLTVTDVRVQRLQEISEADAEAEGVGASGWDPGLPEDQRWRHPVNGAAENFAALWNTIHGPGAWEADPAVVALTFTVERRNIDA